MDDLIIYTTTLDGDVQAALSWLKDAYEFFCWGGQYEYSFSGDLVEDPRKAEAKDQVRIGLSELSMCNFLTH